MVTAKNRGPGRPGEHPENPLQRARIAAGIKQMMLARMIGKHPSEISDWEASRKRPRPETLEKLRHALGDPLEGLQSWGRSRGGGAA